MTHIHNLIGVSYKNYDDFRHYHFTLWCLRKAKELDLPHRALVTNELLFKWYQSQWMEIEHQFARDYNHYIDQGIDNPNVYHDLFIEYPSEINATYPAPIVNNIKLSYKFNHIMKQQNEQRANQSN